MGGLHDLRIFSSLAPPLSHAIMPVDPSKEDFCKLGKLYMRFYAELIPSINHEDCDETIERDALTRYREKRLGES